MNSFLKNIGLLDTLNIELNINRIELIEKLWKITYKTNTSFISLERDTAIPTRFEYRGMIDNNGFTLKKRIRLFDINLNNPVFRGKISDQNDRTFASIEIVPSAFQIFSSVMILCFFLIAIYITLQATEKDFYFLAFTIIITIMQYFTLKRGIRRGKYDFERELIYIVQKH